MRIVYFTLLTLFLLALSGCRDIQIKTIINNDGTVTRTYIVIQDIQFKKKEFTNITEDKKQDEINRQIENSYFPMDTTWETSFATDTLENVTTISFTKQYKNIKKLREDFENNEYKLKPLKPQIEVKRNFKWFNTVNIYKEKYHRIFRGQPYKQYFTEAEIKKIRSRKANDNDTTQLKYYAWVANSVVDEIIYIINKESDTIYNLNAWKRFMYDKIAENTFSTPSENKNPFILPEIAQNRDDFDFSDSEMLISTIKRYSEINLPKETEKKVQEILEQKMELYMSLFTDDLLFSVRMPGQIYKTNADSIRGKTVFWKMDPFIAGSSVEMVLKTKQNNAGIPITIGVIIISLLSYWMLRRKRR